MATNEPSSSQFEFTEPLDPNDVFVAYARADEEKLRPVISAIVEAGASIWIDTDSLTGATLWGAEIVKAITAAKVVVLAASSAAFHSQNVTKEICLAHEKGKFILPILLGKADIPPNVEYQLAGIHRINFFEGNSEKNINAILKALRQAGVVFHPRRPIIPFSNAWVTPERARIAFKDGDGRGVKIAILDSGVNVTHPLLHGIRLVDNLSLTQVGLKIEAVPNDVGDVFGHGTAMTGIIRTVAPEAKIGSFRVLGESLSSRTAIILEGARQAIDRSYHIILCSLGCGIPEHVLKYKLWLDEAYLKGIHVVSGCNNIEPTRQEWPGSFPNVISVDKANSHDHLRHCVGRLPQFAAPGIDVDVAWLHEERKRVSGSSFAAARVAAYLAKIISMCGPISPTLAQALLQEIATRGEDLPSFQK